MSRPGLRARFPRLFSPASLILLAGLLTFLAVVWLRRPPAPTELERMIAANAPDEYVHALAAGADSTLYVGTSLGVIAGKGRTGWQRPAGLTGDVLSLVPVSGGFYLADGQSGLLHIAENRRTGLLTGRVEAVAASASHLLAFHRERGLLQSHNGGASWQAVPAIGQNLEILALAIDPQTGARLAAGGLNGFIALSDDGGSTWRYPVSVGRSVSSIQFDPSRPERLWAAAGGTVLRSDDHGLTWRSVPLPVKERIVVAIAFPHAGQGPAAITSDGLLFTLNP